MSRKDDKEMDQFIRIAMAQIKSKYRFRPQRLAVAAKMYIRWKNRENTGYEEKD